MNKTDIFLRRLETDLRCEWEDLVELALAVPQEAILSTIESLAASCHIGPDSIRRKVEAIRYAATLGHGAEELKQMGQEKVISDFIKSRRVESYGKTVTLKWSIPGSQRQLVQDQEKRVKSLLGLQTSEQFFDWWLGQVTNATDEEIRQSAGDSNERS